LTVISVIENNSNQNLHGLIVNCHLQIVFQITGTYRIGRGRKFVIAAISIEMSEAKPERETVIGLLRICQF